MVSSILSRQWDWYSSGPNPGGILYLWGTGICTHSNSFSRYLEKNSAEYPMDMAPKVSP